MALGDIQFGGYTLPSSFTVESNETEFESDIQSIPMSIGSSDPLSKVKQRVVTLVGGIAPGLPSSGAAMLASATDVRAELDRIFFALARASRGGVQPLIPEEWDRFYMARPDKPRYTAYPGYGLKFQEMSLPFICGDPRAYLCTPGNLVPDSDFELLTQYWTLSAQMVLNIIAGTTGNTFSVAGSGIGLGNPVGFQTAYSALIPVVPGQTYIFSGAIDATHCTSAQPQWQVLSADVSTVLASASATLGSNARFFGTYTPAAGVYFVRLNAAANNTTVPNSFFVTFSDPKFELGSVATAYTPDIMAPQHVISTPNITTAGARTLAATNAGNYRGYPVIVLRANAGATVGFSGLTLQMTNPDGSSITITFSSSMVIANGQILVVNCDPLRPAAYYAPQIGSRTAMQGANNMLQYATFASTTTNFELFPYLDPGNSVLTLTATGTPPSGTYGFQASLIWDDVSI